MIAPLCLWLFGLAFVMPGVTTAALGLFPRNAGSASALMGSLQMAMGFIGAALCGLSANSTAAMALVPPILGSDRRCRLSRVESAAPGIKRAYRSRVVAAGLPGVRA